MFGVRVFEGGVNLLLCPVSAGRCIPGVGLAAVGARRGHVAGARGAHGPDPAQPRDARSPRRELNHGTFTSGSTVLSRGERANIGGPACSGEREEEEGVLQEDTEGAQRRGNAEGQSEAYRGKIPAGCSETRTVRSRSAARAGTARALCSPPLQLFFSLSPRPGGSRAAIKPRLVRTAAP